MFSNLNTHQWLLIGLLIRLAVIPFTFHSDILFLYYAPYVLNQGEWDAYGVAKETFADGYYPPLTLLIFGAIEAILSAILSDFEQFFDLPNLLHSEIIQKSNIFFQNIFFMKLPFLVIEAVFIKTIWKALPDQETRKAYTIAWMINPLPIYGIYMFGKFDLLPALFVIFAFLFSTHKGKEHLSYLSLGLGFLLKIFPIIFFPLLLCLNCRTVKDFMRYCIYCFLPIFLLYGVAFWVSGPSAFGILDTFSEQHIHSTFEVAKLISFLGLRLVQALVYLSACLHILFFQKESFNHLTSAKYFLLIYLSLSWEMPLSSIHQFTWILPFLLFLIVHNKKWSKLFYLFVVTIFLGGLRSRHDAFGIFAPLNPELFLSLPSLKDITGYFFNQNVYDQMINFSFKVISTIFIILILRSLYMRPIKSTS